MPLSQRQIYNLSFPFIELANELDITILQELAKLAESLTNQPNQNLEPQLRNTAQTASGEFVSQGQDLAEQNLSEAYKQGVLDFDSEIASLVETPRNEGNPIPDSRFPRKSLILGLASSTARDKLKDYSEHLGLYGQFENTLKEVIVRFQDPYVRSTVQNYRELARQAIDPEFINGNKATRIQLSQRILNDFAEKGTETIIFPSGHRMSVEAFAEREARSYINKVSVQASTSRAAQRGYDLVRITQYAGASPMCAPHQGNVYSLSGNSDQYPPFSDAVFDGSYTYGAGIGHSYCGHTTNTYIPGVSEGLGPLSNDPAEQRILNEMGEAKGNRFIFNAEQEQRRIERMIRKHKRRKAVALTESERQRAQTLIGNWQARQRAWIDEHEFLRRQYKREAV